MDKIKTIPTSHLAAWIKAEFTGIIQNFLFTNPHTHAHAPTHTPQFQVCVLSENDRVFLLTRTISLFCKRIPPTSYMTIAITFGVEGIFHINMANIVTQLTSTVPIQPLRRGLWPSPLNKSDFIRHRRASPSILVVPGREITRGSRKNLESLNHGHSEEEQLHLSQGLPGTRSSSCMKKSKRGRGWENAQWVARKLSKLQTECKRKGPVG